MKRGLNESRWFSVSGLINKLDITDGCAVRHARSGIGRVLILLRDTCLDSFTA